MKNRTKFFEVLGYIITALFFPLFKWMHIENPPITMDCLFFFFLLFFFALPFIFIGIAMYDSTTGEFNDAITEAIGDLFRGVISRKKKDKEDNV